MKQAGQVVLFRFPQTDLESGKLRPALLLGRLPGPYDDWLVCMISSQLRRQVDGFDEVVGVDDEDFASSGLKGPSLIRIGRLAVVAEAVLEGALGMIGTGRLQQIREQLAHWMQRGRPRRALN